MSAAEAEVPDPTATESSIKLDDLIPLFGGGVALAGVAIVACALINAMAVALFDYLGRDDALAWSTAVIVGLGVFSVLVSVLVGRWLFNLRRWIGTKSDPTESEMVRRKRRAFTIGAMVLYVPLTPLIWVLVVAIANSAT